MNRPSWTWLFPETEVPEPKWFPAVLDDLEIALRDDAGKIFANLAETPPYVAVLVQAIVLDRFVEFSVAFEYDFSGINPSMEERMATFAYRWALTEDGQIESLENDALSAFEAVGHTWMRDNWKPHWFRLLPHGKD